MSDMLSHFIEASLRQSAGGEEEQEESHSGGRRRRQSQQPRGAVPRNKTTFPSFIPDVDGLDGDGGDGVGGNSGPTRVWSRAPNDPAPYKRFRYHGGVETAVDEDEGEDAEEEEEEEPEGVCFPSVYASDERHSDGAGERELWSEDMKSAYETVLRFINENYACNMTNADLVENVSKYYHEQIRGNYPELPPWSRRSIHNFIFHYSDAADGEERQATEAIKAVFYQIEFLRNKTAMRQSVGLGGKGNGAVVPDVKHIKMMADLCKVHAQLISAKRQRRR